MFVTCNFSTSQAGNWILVISLLTKVVVAGLRVSSHFRTILRDEEEDLINLYPELHYEIIEQPSTDYTDSAGSYIMKRKRRLTWQPISYQSGESDYDPKILRDPPKYSPDSDMGSVEADLHSIPEVKETSGPKETENVMGEKNGLGETEETNHVMDDMNLGATARNIGGLAEFENSEEAQVVRRVRSQNEPEDTV